MKLLYIFSCVVVLYLGPVPGNVVSAAGESLIPDDSMQVTIKPPSVSSPVGQCIAAGKTTTANVRLWKFTSKAGSTFVRRLVSDELTACFNGSGQLLPATDFLDCSDATDKAGLEMFWFVNETCTGFPFIITMEQQSCLGSGPNVFYTKLENIVTARRPSETGRSPDFREQASSRVLPVSTDVIVVSGGYKGIEGKGLNDSQTYRSLNVLSQCQCEYFCNSDTACNAYSLLELGPNSYLCSLADQDVYVNTPSSMTGSFYAVKKDLVDQHESDNLIYRRFESEMAGFSRHKSACTYLPGFRLVTVRFEEQMPIMLKICLGRVSKDTTEACTDESQWFYVDMIKVAGVSMIQGVLPVNQTNLVSILDNEPATVDHYIYAHSRKLHDESATKWDTKPVCQANVFGVNW